MCFPLVGMWLQLFPHLYLGNVVGLSKLWRALPTITINWVKLIRVLLGLLSVCVRGYQPPTVHLSPPQHHSTHCQLCLDCTSLSSLALSSMLLFSHFFLYVCVSLLFSFPEPLQCRPPSCPHLTKHKRSAFRHCKSRWWLLPTQNVAGSACFPGIQMVWCIWINCL